MAVGTVCTVPIIVGFGTGGVVAGSLATVWQSSIGNVAVGSLFAALQSAGATGVFSTGAVYGGMATATGIASINFGTWRNNKGGGASESPKGEGGGDQEEEHHHYKNHNSTSPTTSSTTPEDDDAPPTRGGEEQEQPDDYDDADKEKDGSKTDISENDNICENVSTSKNAIICPLCHTVMLM
jgi:hypothetical protein